MSRDVVLPLSQVKEIKAALEDAIGNINPDADKCWEVVDDLDKLIKENESNTDSFDASMQPMWTSDSKIVGGR